MGGAGHSYDPPKVKGGAGLMISDFVEEFDGYLQLSSAEYDSLDDDDKPSGRAVRTVDPALDSVDTVLIRKYFRNARDYITAYREGHVPGRQLEDAVKQYKSHRRVPKDM